MVAAIVDADGVTPPPASPPPDAPPPPQSRGGGGLTERQKKQAEEQKRNNEARVIAELNAKLAAANAQLKLALEKEKKRKEKESSGESANPGRQKKMSNASTRRKQVPIFRFNYFSGCHFLTVCLCTGKA